MANQRELTWGLDAKTGKATTDIQKVDKELDKVKSNMMSIDKQSGVFGKLGGGIATVGSKIQSVGSNISRVGSGISGVSGKIASAGAKMTAFAAPVALAFKKGVDGALELDTAIRQVTTLADQDVLPVGKIEQEVRRISDATGIAQKEISESMYEALSSGIDSADVVGFVEQGVQLTKAGFTDMPTVIDATTTALNAYGLQGAEATSHIQDVMVKTQDLGKITVDELGKNIGRVIPFASAAGVSIDQLGAGFSILTAKNGDAAMSATNLAAVISELNTSGTKADKALREGMGQSFKEMMDDGASLGDVLQSLSGIAEGQGLQLGDMFGNKMATSAANTLLADGPDQFNSALDAMVNSGGSVEANFEKMQGPAEKLRQTQNRLKNSFMEMGASMIPAFEEFADGISKITEKFNSLDEGTKQMIGKAALALTVVGPILAVVGTIGGAIGTVISGIGGMVSLVGSAVSAIGGAIASAGGAMALITGPVGIAVGVVLGLVAAGVALYKNWDTVKEKAGQLGEAIGNAFNSAKEHISNVASAIGNVIGSIAQGVVALAMAPLKIIMMIGDKIKGFLNIFGGLGDKIGEAFSGIGEKVGGIFGGLGDSIGGFVEDAKGKFDGLKSTAATKFNDVKSDVTGFTAEAKGSFDSLLSSASEKFNSIGQSASGMTDGANAAVGNLGADMDAVFANIQANADSSAEGIKGSFSGISEELNQSLTDVGTVPTEQFEAIKTSITEVKTFITTSFTEIGTLSDAAITQVTAKVSSGVTAMMQSMSQLMQAGISTTTNLSNAFTAFAGVLTGTVNGAISSTMAMFNALRASATSSISGIMSAWNSLRAALSNPINARINISKGLGGGSGGVPGHADGLYNVPYDEYPAMLHKGEMVVTAQGSNQLRAMGATENGFANPPTSEPTSSLMGDLRPSVTNNESSTSNSSNFSPVLNITINGSGDSKTDGNVVADIVEEKLMQLFTTANLQRG